MGAIKGVNHYAFVYNELAMCCADRESAQSINNSLKKAKRIPFPGEPVKPSQ